MGNKKDSKTKAAEKKARNAAKQDKKAKQKEKKSKAKNKNDDSDAESVDLETVLAEYAKQQEQFLKVTEASCEPPPPRSSATLIGSPSNSNELFLFGGEHFNGALATFYNDLYIYQINKGEWRKVTSPNSPLPRSGHAWCRGGNSGGVYLFGGEFSSPKQGTFYHYNDFWRLDPSSREWTRIESKKGPPARSGHRMTYYKNYIILFGGFQDTSQQTKYLQDLWIYDTQSFTWHNPQFSQKPEARSSFSLLPHESGAVLYGGYSRVKTDATVGKKTKGGAHTTRSVLKPMIHQDTWFLRVTQPLPEEPLNTPPKMRWERRKKAANAPNPPRAGATMAYHKTRGLCFGGVHDVEESEEGIDSEFFDLLFAWNINRNNFFPLVLRKPRGPAKKQISQPEKTSRRDRGKADEEELLRNLAALETKGSIEEADTIQLEAPSKEEEAEPKPVEMPILSTMPHPRFNAQLAVQDDILYIYGGTYEVGDREFTFDEMYAIDLVKMDGVKQIFHRELENWVGSEDEESDDEDEDEDEDEEDDPEDEEMDSVSVITAATSTTAASIETMQTVVTDAETETEPLAEDSRPQPRPFESLKDFFLRTSDQWQEMLLEELKSKDHIQGDTTVKEIRKRAFEMAEDRWWDCREEIIELEEQQEEAGIGEVVSLKDKETVVSGPGRRR